MYQHPLLIVLGARESKLIPMIEQLSPNLLAAPDQCDNIVHPYPPLFIMFCKKIKLYIKTFLLFK
jgi:hypothetical protein